MQRVPFDPKELTPILVEEPTMPGFPKKVMYDSPITIKENYLMSLRKEKPFWMPNSFFDFSMMCPENAENVARAFVFENKPMDLDHVGGPDFLGIEWEYVPSVGGSMVRGGNPKVPDITEWEKYVTIPDPKNVMDWEAVAARNKDFCDPRKPLEITILNGLFERLISMMDMTNALMALIDEDEQEAVHRLFDKLADFYPKIIRKYKEYYHIEILTFHDDWGSQRAPFFSLDTVREMLVPYLKRIVDATHELGVIFELHSCGKNEMLVPAMIEAGVDMWNGQPMNDKKMLVDKYGSQMIFGAAPEGINNDSSVEEVRESCRKFVEKFKDYRIYCGAASDAMFAPKVKESLYEFSRIAKCGTAE